MSRCAPNQKIEGLPELKPRPGKQDLDLRGDTKSVYEQVGQLFGIKITFDPDLPARPVRLHADDVDFSTALKILGVQTGTFFRALTSNLLFVAQDNAEKRRQYAAQAKQTFVLPASVGTEEMTELVRVLREMTGSTRVELDAQDPRRHHSRHSGETGACGRTHSSSRESARRSAAGDRDPRSRSK